MTTAPVEKMRLNKEMTAAAVAISVAVVAVMWSTLKYRYLFIDETWLIRPWNYSGYGRMGRPLFDYLVLAMEQTYYHIGIDAIYVFRVVGMALALANGLIFHFWLRHYGYSFLIALFGAVMIILQPALVILYATTFEHGFALLSASLAMLAVIPLIDLKADRTGWAVRLAIFAVLSMVSLCIYQPTFLVIFAMMVIPVLRAGAELRRYYGIIAVCVTALVVFLVYYLAWKNLYLTEVDGTIWRYDPRAASISQLLASLPGFFRTRMIQIANLWYVENLVATPIMWTGVALVAAAFAILVWREKLFGLLKLAFCLGALPACDVFRLASQKGPTYLTAPSLSAAWVFLLVWAVSYLLPRQRWREAAVGAVTVAGVAVASWTTIEYISLRNGREFRAIQQVVIANPDMKRLHIFGSKTRFPQLFEFGWHAAGQASYTRHMTYAITRHYMEYFPTLGISNVRVAGDPKTAECIRPDVALRIPESASDCTGAQCQLDAKQMAAVDWTTCELPPGL